ncbi:MAG TPA: HlyD family secretion protein [Flavilitoribacter sp.]|nr:HlyD family secretion protein [Flavilitoribacter sp.]HMQ90940.1 HlyD family secretion protein [Flavilitoribacter sp.]
MEQETTTLETENGTGDLPKLRNRKVKKSRLPLLIGLLILGGIVSAGVYFYIQSANFETTDNAQVDGDIFQVKAGITAYVQSIRFDDNSEVHQGDTLILFDNVELQARVAEAEAALENARASLAVAGNRASASVENAAASVITSKSYEQTVVAAKANLDKAQNNYDRVNSLLKAKAATQEQFETADAALQMAKADYAKALELQKSSVTSSQGLQAQSKAEYNQIDLSRAMVKQREAELLMAREQLTHACIIAPFSGIVAKRNVQEGQFVGAGQSLCAIVETDHVWVTANFKETQLNDIRVGQDVVIQLDAYPDLKLTGKVESYSGATGAKFSLLPPDNATGNFIKITQRFPLRISIDQTLEELPVGLYPGLSAFVKVKTRS